MKKDAVIKVFSCQTDNEDEAIEIVTKGEFYKKDDSFFAVYEETKISGMEGTTTILKVKGDEFSLIRKGTTNTKMKFIDKDESISLYNTPYGTLELIICTNKLDIQVNEDGGEVSIDYDLIVDGQKTSKTKLKVNITAKN
ncbi:DUF1934 domain-containing protein [Clostridium grantii]|uniref:Uncharacterized beta-barrel protein YwiB, DUF1934 family n=1 Tax=Clostridium grantii DSM 8605 TaxID=1121316 RepID=A0A1M5TKL1_9CLOT|nr:DUF1934 domain-containing protein [Clostridium grantii]SHH51218.1 Uncharacterized beta-barrel protein YwiB, DUF1934 family [Clostridium grantii DSM 8605]